MYEFRNRSGQTKMSSSFIPNVPKSARQDFIARQSEHFLRSCAMLNNRVPGLLFNRLTQLLLDSGCAGLAFFLAFQLRFDGTVPLRYRSIMLVWLAGIVVLRPMCIWMLGAYASIWRYFNLRDMFSLSLAAALPSAVLHLLRLHSARRAIHPIQFHHHRGLILKARQIPDLSFIHLVHLVHPSSRSEERRVGKE